MVALLFDLKYFYHFQVYFVLLTLQLTNRYNFSRNLLLKYTKSIDTIIATSSRFLQFSAS